MKTGGKAGMVEVGKSKKREKEGKEARKFKR